MHYDYDQYYAIKTSFLYLDNHSKEESSKEDMKLDGSIISLEFAPLTKGIKISNIPQGTSSDDIMYKFSNPKFGGGQVTNVTLDKENGVANVYFEKSSGVNSALYSFFRILNRFSLSEYSSIIL